MLLIIDPNEKATNPKVVADLQKSFSHVIVSKSRLKAGDVNLPLDDGNLLAIERKTPSDFLNSIVDGRIFEQVENMAKYSKYSAFIVTGRFLYKDKSDDVVIELGEGETETRDRWKGSSVRNAITVLQYSGCPVIFCPPHKYAMMISELYTLVNKPSERQAVRKNRIITFPPVDERVQFIAQLPHIGLTLAQNIMEFTNTMDGGKEGECGDICSALQYITIMMTIDKASRPVGWGHGKVLTVRKFLGLASDEYLGKIRELEVIDHAGETTSAVEINGSLYVKVKKELISKDKKGRISIAPF